MCRLFGFRSVIQSQVHQSLVSAENALVTQSGENPDGWGVAYFLADAPHLIKSISSAIDDSLFKRVSGVVSSETVLAHIRRATAGTNSIINTHPFQFGRWVFAHNGNIARFQQHRKALEGRIAPNLRRFVLGDTDSEVIFHLILTHLARRVELHRVGAGLFEVVDAVRDALVEIEEVAGPYHPHDEGSPDETYLTFILTNGTTMVAHQGGKQLHYSTYKRKCSVRKSCPHLVPACENPSDTGYVNHLIFSSEPLQGENVWIKMGNGDIVGVDWRMQLHVSKASVPGARSASSRVPEPVQG